MNPSGVFRRSPSAGFIVFLLAALVVLGAAAWNGLASWTLAAECTAEGNSIAGQEKCFEVEQQGDLAIALAIVGVGIMIAGIGFQATVTTTWTPQAGAGPNPFGGSGTPYASPQAHPHAPAGGPPR